MNLRIISLLYALILAFPIKAAPLWLRYPAISPDGSQIAFTYKGHIYVVSTRQGGGEFARSVTSDDSYACYPVWSPDSKTLAYACDRFGNFDIFTVPASGGVPTRITTHSAHETPFTFSNDGRSIYFGAAISDAAESALFPKGSMEELYRVSIRGGRYERVLGTPAQWICLGNDGKSFLYQDRKGGENEWRKHHTSSVTRDIWNYDTVSGKHTRLTTWEGEDRNPRYSPDNRSVYFLSERSGSFNVWNMPADNPSEARQVTFFKTHPVRFLTISRDGTLCFGYNGEIYTLDSGSPSPRKLDVKIVPGEPADKYARLPVKEGHDVTVSPDGRQIAFVSRGEIFVTSAAYNTTRRITTTAEAEENPDFAADNRTLAYASERDGHWNIYTAAIIRDEDPDFPNATVLEEKPLFKAGKTDRTCPKYSPDGKELAFVEDRCRLMVLNLASGRTRRITDGERAYSTDGNMDYAWSPDGKWFALSYTGNRHHPYSDIGLVSAQGGPIRNITNTGYFDRQPVWSPDGNAILFSSDRYGMRSHASWGSLHDVMIVYLNRRAYEIARMSEEEYAFHKEAEKRSGKDCETKDSEKESDSPKDIIVELDGIEERIVRLTPFSGNLRGYTLDKKGEHLYYSMSYGAAYDIWQLNLRSRENKALHKGLGGTLVWDERMETLFSFGRGMKKFKNGTGTAETVQPNGVLQLDRRAERAYMFDRIRRQERERFYEESMHGVDWEAMCRNYERFLPHIANDYDFAEMASELLGELNVSHTGCRYSRPASPDDDATADLGLIFDFSYRGDGLLVAEVVAGAPFDRASSDVGAGDIVERINGREIPAGADFHPLLNHLAGQRTLVSLYRPSAGKRWDETVVPISQGALSKLLYKRWVKRRAADVERLSNGRLGYVHIESMGDASFRTVYADMLGRYNHCEGIVVDTRFNGGGRLHEDIEILLSGEKYLTQVIRGKEACDMPSRRWNKPSVMLTCEANYSNAHGTPWVYQYRKIGKVVGMPVPGTMTSVSWERLQNPALVFGIPVVGYRTASGAYLENSQLEPDVVVANTPELVVCGRDEQLERAVKTLLEQIDAPAGHRYR